MARAAIGEPVEMRNLGLLESAVHRPRARVLGNDAYPDLLSKTPPCSIRSPATTRSWTAQASGVAGDLRLLR
jgi:hypothetical protein